jgi:prefoldin alpha subunit
MEMDEKQQELIYKLSVFEQQMQQIQQQLQMVEQGTIELKSLDKGLEELNGKNGTEFMAPFGRGIYAKAKLLSEELLVDIGEKNFVKKTIPQTKEMIAEQLKRLEEVAEQLNCSLEELNKEFSRMIESVEGDRSKE